MQNVLSFQILYSMYFKYHIDYDSGQNIKCG
jgi:hypothetical protein